MSRHGHVCLRRIGVLGRSRAKHATLPASLTGLPYESVVGADRTCAKLKEKV